MRTTFNFNPELNGTIQLRDMADPSFFDPVRVSTQTLAALDWRPYHFAVQPFHYLIRVAHIVSVSAFFGGIGLLDFRLMGWRGTVPLRPFAEHVLPWLWVTFAVAAVTGAGLFFFEPVHVGAHAYFMPKMLAILFGLANAALFHRTIWAAALRAEAQPPLAARIGGAISLLCWTAAVVFSSLNVEAMPKVLLR